MMGRLVKFELSKLKNQKSLFICTGAMVLSLFLTVLSTWGMGKLGEIAMGPEEVMAMLGLDFITTVMQAANSGSLAMIGGIVVAIFVCSEYSQGTIKNIVARGYSRTKIYFAKLIAVSVMICAMYLVAIIFGALFGILFYGFSAPPDMSWIGSLAVQLVATIALGAFAFFMSAVFKKMAPAVILILVIPTVLQLILTVIDLFAETNISDCWISSVYSSLCTVSLPLDRILISLGVSVAYVGGFAVAGWALSRKSSY